MNDLIGQHPWLMMCVGRRGAGKTYEAARVARQWRTNEGAPGSVLGIDPVAVDPPHESHLAYHCDEWSPVMVDGFGDGDGVALVCVDEADLFAPQADARRNPPPPLVDLVRRGRHRGVSLLLCTQRPAAVMRAAFALADVVVICQLTDRRDLDRVCELHGVAEYRELIATTTRPGKIITWTPAGVVCHVEKRGGRNG